VTLLVDGQSAATAPFTSSGSIQVPLMIEGTAIHHLVASYSGSIVAAPSASPQLETSSYLSGQDFTLQPAQTLISISPGESSKAIKLLIGSINGWSGTVSLSCEDSLPSGYACTFSPGSSSGPGTVALTLVPKSGLPAVGLLLIPILWLPRTRDRRLTLLAVMLSACLFVLSGCGSASGARSITSSIVTVRAVSGSTLHSAQIEFTSGTAR
jgi:hypothetical protein